MFRSCIATEFLKYRRTFIPWLVAVGGFFPMLVALLFVKTGSFPAVWETMAQTGLNFFNMLAPLLVSVIAGGAFVMEFHGGANRMHAYPVLRLLQYGTKLLVVMLLILGMHIVFLIFLFGLGGFFAEDSLSLAFALRWSALTLLIAAGHAMLAPIAAIAGILFKNTGAYILAGIGCFVLFMSFADSAYARYVLPCVPNEIMLGFVKSGELVPPETAGMLAFSAAMFLILLCAGALCYTRAER